MFVALVRLGLHHHNNCDTSASHFCDVPLTRHPRAIDRFTRHIDTPGSRKISVKLEADKENRAPRGMAQVGRKKRGGTPGRPKKTDNQFFDIGKVGRYAIARMGWEETRYGLTG